ncbi:hypothetical protein [Roseisolibacter sp. H3M3-2]|uniref:hypothetical protein n=1 Tax=Roseisolibacter sp. H3M3-2 TaxID=3031323 RepID=UPI0023DADF69|nr:hypothetical protein [Roseisolibacter sp. H3M3-2]MDF1504453.1 hypothetical protein [Roseisolibacter sp. H3M3-2]
MRLLLVLVQTLDLLAGPQTAAEGVAYHQARQRAEGAFAAGRAAEVEGLADSLARVYPRDHRNWHLLARLKASLGRHDEAAAAYQRVGAIVGWRSPYHYPGVMTAVQRLAAGDRAGALDELRRELDERRNFYVRSAVFGWPGLAALQADTQFLRIVGRPDVAGLARDDRWRADLDFLVAELTRVSPDYHDAPLPAEFTRRVAALRAAIPRLSDDELLVGMNRALAALGLAHTAVFPRPGSGRLPVRPYAFPDGVYIVEADAAHRDLVGTRLVAVGGTPVDSALRLLGAHRNVSGPMMHVWGAADLASTPHLRGTRVIGGGDTTTLTVRGRDGRTRTVRVPTDGPGLPGRQDRLVAPPGAEAPLFLRALDQSHWDAPLPGHDAHYVQLNQVRPDPDETVAQFGLRLRRVLAERRPRHLVLDLRHNNCGATGSYPELLRTLVAYTTQPDARLYVLIGRRVFSATANLVTDLERLARPVFVGEPTSACCDFAGDPNAATLPYSRLGVELASVRWNLAFDVYDARRELVPDVPVQLDAASYFAGRDPAMDAVLALIRGAGAR